MSAAFTAEHSPSQAPHTEEPGLGPCPPSFDDSMCCSPRTLGRGAQAIRKTCSRLSPGTYLLAKWTRRTALRGPCAGGQRQCAGSSRIHSLFTISNTRGPLHEEQDTRVSLTALRTTKRLDPWWSQTGSNRRPHACKARALPTELWPHGDETTAIRSRMVGLGRLERPTSPLSGVRSNHLSYRPDPRYGTKTGRQRKLQAPSSESRGQAQKSPSSAP